MGQLVLVTGGSGFIAGHCILRLLERGYRVRTTVRSLQREPDVRAVLREAGMAADAPLDFVAADLTDDTGWSAAMAEVSAVLHVASPVAPGHVENEDDLIGPAREGTLRVLRAARDARVTRVVLTSAFHAVAWGHPHGTHRFTEDDWTILDGPGVDAYAKSKTLAERAAWDFTAIDESLELTTMLPVAVMGPVLGSTISGSNRIIRSMLDGDMPGLPDLYIPIVDVRDVAAAHVLALEVPEAIGQRFLLSDGPPLSMRQIGTILRDHLGSAAASVPTFTLPHAVVRLGARFSPQLRAIAPDLGHARLSSHAKAGRILGWEPRPAQDAIVAAARSLVGKHLVRNRDNVRRM